MAADNNGDQDSDGYTNLEEYLNELAAFPAPTAILFLGAESERYADARNFGLAGARGRVLADAHWQPSRFDLVRSLSSRMVVDAPGQSARALELAGASVPAIFEVSAGFLEVIDYVSVGAWLDPTLGHRAPKSGAALLLTGGELRVRGRLLLGGAASGGGTLVLGGGGLRAGSVELAKDGVLRVTAAHRRTARVAGALRLGGRLELAPGAELRPGERLVLFSARGDVSGRFASVPPGHAVDVVGGSVVLRSTARVPGPELYSAAPGPLVSGVGG
jgi:hypothetical protein